MSHRDATDLFPSRNAAGHEYVLASSCHMLERPHGCPTRKTNGAPYCMEWLSTVVMRNLLTMSHFFYTTPRNSTTVTRRQKQVSDSPPKQEHSAKQGHAFSEGNAQSKHFSNEPTAYLMSLHSNVENPSDKRK